MKKINLNLEVIGLDGKTISNANLGKILANELCGKTPNIEPAKAMDWAMKAFNEGYIELDNTDLEKLKAFVNNHENFSNLLKVQLINCFNAALVKE